MRFAQSSGEIAPMDVLFRVSNLIFRALFLAESAGGATAPRSREKVAGFVFALGRSDLGRGGLGLGHLRGEICIEKLDLGFGNLIAGFGGNFD